MNEALAQTGSLIEVLDPRNTPEMAFQSYEKLGGDQNYRAQQRKAFLEGEIMQPVLDYPYVREEELKDMLPILQDVLSVADGLSDKVARGAVWGSAGYRMAEIYWLLSSERLGRIHPRLSVTEIDVLAADVQDKNEQLYGTPERVISEAVLAETWAQVKDKQLGGEAPRILQELANGTTVRIADEDVQIDPLAGSGSERLPEIPEDLLLALNEKLHTDYADVVDLVWDYWNDIINRPDGERAFTPHDMFDLFKAVHAARDPENSSGVGVVFDPGATALSWETPLMSVKVGGMRSPIKSPEIMLGKIYHEYLVHGGRAVAGLQTSLPVLGTGLYTEADTGELTDYLTFEEGLASLCEIAPLPEGDRGWSSSNMERYMAINLAYEGKDFRQIYEVAWRVRVLMNAKNGTDVSEVDIAKAQSLSYASVVRIFRGTPMDMPRSAADGTPRILTFNKDLVYLKGKLQMIEYWKRVDKDPEKLDILFKAKFDPLNKRQLELVRGAYTTAA